MSQAIHSLRPVTRAVITGSSGFIGRALALHLLDRKVEVVVADRHPAQLSCKNHVIDLSTPGSLDSLLDPSTVLFHMAARADVGASVADPRRDFESNIPTMFEVLESARRTGARVIYPSTASVFDNQNALPLKETDHIKPTSPYAASKVAGEAYCAAYHRTFNLDVRVARMFSVYGVGMNRFVIYDMIRRIQRNPQRIEIRGDGEQIRDYLYIDDTVRGLVHIAEHGTAGEDYNLASGVPVRLLDLAHQIAKLMGHPNLEVVPSNELSPGDVPKWYANVAKLAAIGFSPQIALEEGLERTIRFLADKNLPAGIAV